MQRYLYVTGWRGTMATNQSQTTKSGCFVPTIVKVLGAITGLIAAIAGLVTAFSAFSPATPTANGNQNIAATTPTVPAAANPTWKVIINASNTATTYQGYTTASGYV